MVLRLVFLCVFISAATLHAADNPTDSAHHLLTGPAVPVVVWNRTITEVRMGWKGLSAEERAAEIEKRIAQLPEEALVQEIIATEATIDDFQGLIFYAGGRMLFGIAREDLENPKAELSTVRDQTVANLNDVFQARLAQRRPDILFWGITWTLAATIALFVVLFALKRFVRKAHERVARMSIHLPHVAGIDLSPAFVGFARYSIRIPAFVFTIFSLYSWLTFVLGRFPLTKPLANTLGHWLLQNLQDMGRSALSGLPGLFTVLVIILVTRILVRALDGFFSSVENGGLEISWMQPETAKATRRIAGMLVWLFALTVAYPYIPGSSSDAFKGVSVFAGLLLTLGSAGMVNQVMSGLVVVYSRMMKPGDMVKVGDISGVVTELGFLSTKVRTPRGHEVTMPNAIIVNSSVNNFSRFDSARGPTIATTVTIGYDTPWRQVHALLKLASSRTEGINQASQTDILQTALSDYYVEYELRCVINQVQARMQVLSDLHAEIQDAFNEHGVQIMSPHFVAQPEENIVVPKGKWAPSPAVPTADPA